MSEEIKINKMNRSITFINNNYCFSQFGVATEILDLIESQKQEIKRLKEDNEYLNKVNIELSTEKNRLNNIIKNGINEELRKELDEILKCNQAQASRIDKTKAKLQNMFDNGDENTILDDLLELDKILGSDKE